VGGGNGVCRATAPRLYPFNQSGGSRSEAEAKAESILASVMRTAGQQGRPVLETIKMLLRAEWSGKDIALLTELFPAETS
jgi:hypothetical protein